MSTLELTKKEDETPRKGFVSAQTTRGVYICKDAVL